MKFIIAFIALTSLAHANQSKPLLNCSFKYSKDNKVIEQFRVNKNFDYYDLNDIKVSSKNKRFTVALFATYLPEPTIGAKVFDFKKKTSTYFPEVVERQFMIEDGISYNDSYGGTPDVIPKGAESLIGTCHISNQ